MNKTEGRQVHTIRNLMAGTWMKVDGYVLDKTWGVKPVKTKKGGPAGPPFPSSSKLLCGCFFFLLALFDHFWFGHFGGCCFGGCFSIFMRGSGNSNHFINV